ncbi:MAG: TlpA family protein disulfide reductase [Nitrospiraceae bacterium]|nr:MAG: TlpA family protein disulfide reductase [Nitrospiraceae bacterium]
MKRKAKRRPSRSIQKDSLPWHGWSMRCRLIAWWCKHFNCRLQKSWRSRSHNVLASLKHVLLAAMLSLVSIVSAGPTQAGDPFVSLKMSRLPAGSMAAPFELTSLDGKVIKSNELAGKVMLVNFWATWCGPCKEEMPSLARLQQQLDPAHFVMLTVTTDLQRQGIAHFLSQLRVDLPVLFDEDQEVSRSFMVRGLPTTIVIARDGTLVGRAVGPRAWDSPEAAALMRHVMESGK